MSGRKKNTARSSPTTSENGADEAMSPDKGPDGDVEPSSAKSHTELPDWRKITPAPLRPAVEALRKAFARNRPNLDRMMKLDCWTQLHPALTDGPPSAESAVFKAHLTICANVVFHEAQRIFTEMLTIGNAKANSLEMDPVEWAGLQIKMLVEDEANRLEAWTKWACDKATVDDINEAKDWRAPRWLAMYPMGAIAYNSMLAWERLGANATAMVLDKHRKSFAELVNGWLESKIADAHVEAARRSPQSVKQTMDGDKILSQASASSKVKEHLEGALRSNKEIIDSFIAKILQTTEKKITKKDIWMVANYSDATEFQRFQRDRRCTETAKINFRRVLSMDPSTFLHQLESKKSKKTSR